MKHTHIFITLLVSNFQFSIFNSLAQTRIGDYIESRTYNEPTKDEPRSFQYHPEGDAFVCINGKNRFTRALYGSHTQFRLETSDRPVFATYNKNTNRNISFSVLVPAISTLHNTTPLRLDSTDYCKTWYVAGRRDYEIKDKAFGQSILRISALALPDKDGAIWKIEFSENVETGHAPSLQCYISEIKAKKLNRNGDMGADPSDAFEAGKLLKSFEITVTKNPVFLVFENNDLTLTTNDFGKTIYENAENARQKVAGQIKINTPDPYFNTLGGALSAAADGIWDGETWQHGAIGWRMPLAGWRAAYTGDFLGWHDRARTHFDAYAASQVTDVPNTIPHPAQDTALHLARALKKWGTPMYSNGYICRNPQRNDQMHHYDMNLVYIDELLWHLNWTGDLDYAKKIFPVIQRSLAWEKRNFDPDDDGLYDAYASFWASDAVMYNGGGTTLGSAYNYRANKLAAMIAEKIGENSQPYQQEADKILSAINQKLWLKDKGWWAEYIDLMGNKLIHPNAAVWSVYTAIDSEVGDIFQNYQATRYVDNYIPHIPLKIAVPTQPSPQGIKGCYTISTSNWLPYAWSVNNVAFAEVGHMALAYWLAGRADEAFNLFKSIVLDGMYLGASPGNVGQISHYDAARGESYRDFGDPVGVYSRALVQGLFGIQPDLLNDKVVVRPGFPKEWNFAEINHPDIDFKFERTKMTETYIIKNKFNQTVIAGNAPQSPHIILQIPATHENIKSLKINGKIAKWTIKENIEFPLIEIKCGTSENLEIKIDRDGKVLQQQKVLLNQATHNVSHSGVFSTDFTQTGNLSLFIKKQQGQMTWWQPIEVEIKEKDADNFSKFTDIQDIVGLTSNNDYVMVNIDKYFNASVTDIFKNEYLAPRSPYTTMQTPTQGIGEWCHPLLNAEIDDSGLRRAAKNGIFTADFGLPFRTPNAEKANNIVFTTLWDNYPEKIEIDLSGTGTGRALSLLMAGTTNSMQSRIANGIVTVRYTDNSTETMELVNPDNWCPIEQDYYIDGKQFCVQTSRPYRVAFKTGIVSRDMQTAMKIKPTEVYGREIDGGAGVILNIPLNKNKELKSLEVKAIANEVIVGLMAVTLVK